jgi:multidrug efflux pump subunit AcrA (membrane-fusion protein)
VKHALGTAGAPHRAPASLQWRGQLSAIALAGSSRLSRWLSRTLLLCFAATLVGLVVLPWQQSVRGMGRVIAFDPLDRRVNVEAPVAGRVKRLLVVEGQRVAKDEVIVEIQDNDPNLLGNLRSQRELLGDRAAAMRRRIAELAVQVQQQERAKTQALNGARQKVASERIIAETARVHYERSEALARSGLVSQRDLELAIQGRDSSAANLASAIAYLDQTEREFDAAIARVRADRNQAQGDLATVDRDASAADVLVNQTMQQAIVAPRDGIVLKVNATEGTFLRPGSPIAIIIPESESRFAEVWLQGNDVPLVTPRKTLPDGTVVPGSIVRLRFEGWPAIQFVGWPSVAVGTFGGEVVFVDATDDGTGKFRIVVAPKPDVLERNGQTRVQNWPKNQWLRQGVRVDAWVLLQQLPLWREVWRQLNAFPPIIADKEPE